MSFLRKLELRGSVSFIPHKDNHTVEFFKSNIRISKKIYLEDPLREFIKSLNGLFTVEELILKLDLDKNKVISLIKYMEENCLIQDKSISLLIERHPFNHVLNFLADYIPYLELEPKFEEIRNSHVVIIGLGAVGSWVSIELAKTGIENFTLIDSDVVEKSNLNRTYFEIDDIKSKKISAMQLHLKSINNKINCLTEDCYIESSDQLSTILNKINSDNILVINCADNPNVDITSSWVNESCLPVQVPYIIAGGYNLHLTLLGPSILPYESACYECIQFQLNYDDQIDDLMKSKKLLKPNRNIGNIAPMAVITSTFVTNESIRILLKSKYLKPIMINRRGHINFFNNKIKFFDFNRNPSCDKCATIDNSYIKDINEFIGEFYNQLNILNIDKSECKITKEKLVLLLSTLNNSLSNFTNINLEAIGIDSICYDDMKYIFGKVFNKLNTV